MTITIYKLDHNGREKFHYTGTLVDRGANWLRIEARFHGRDVVRDFVTFRTGDRMVEWYYTDRWYNVFEVYDKTHGHLKGYYCNITRPAIITPDSISWPDLALDVWVSPQGDILILDEDEFEALQLDAETRAAALHAVDDLRQRIERGDTPFQPTSTTD